MYLYPWNLDMATTQLCTCNILEEKDLFLSQMRVFFFYIMVETVLQLEIFFNIRVVMNSNAASQNTVSMTLLVEIVVLAFFGVNSARKKHQIWTDNKKHSDCILKSQNNLFMSTKLCIYCHEQSRYPTCRKLPKLPAVSSIHLLLLSES